MDEYAEWAIRQYTRIWGEMAPEKLAKTRQEICKGCDMAGKVKIPLPRIRQGWPEFTTMDGCTKCGCPFATKTKVKRYFSLVRMRVVKADCPHPDGSKWPDPEQFYNSKS